MDIEAYLRRIDYDGPTAPTTETLGRLQRAHLRTVPFENLDIHLGRPIRLDAESLFDKIVTRRRGGFCYELNGLFAMLLRELGFEVSMVAAEVARADGGYGPEFDHMALIVALEERMLVDVGFGASFSEPLRLDEPGEQTQTRRSYRIDRDDPRLRLMERQEGKEWTPQYRFSPTPHEMSDYEECCLYHQTSPDSHFTRKRICTRETESGRITLNDMQLIVHVGRRREESPLHHQAAYDSVLWNAFGIRLS